ncbi:MAG: EAL domain-containing protein [Rhodoferax sp.]|uniref:bifunctional diguanylate cyclase/phosphodiesterase n=1 Tax=Rhodoferax sp. TaxID=50421 RepID=UPI00261C9850|nr:EAL domain-containing protein [Rhodoferax sp.]MDD5335886.1 EAL domain-containing protein [Rhodoferax sp.]
MNTQNDRIGRSRRLNLLSIGLALLIAFILLLVHQYVVGRQLMVEELHTEAVIIGANSAAALVFNDTKTAQETIGTVLLSPRIKGGALYHADGRRLAAAGEGNFPLSLAPEGDQDVQSLSELSKSTSYGVVTGFLREDVLIEGGKVGTLLLRVSFSSLYWRLLEYALGVLGIATVALTLAYRLTARLRRRMARAEEQLEQLAFYDQVTGLPNRRLFERELRQALARVARERVGAALLFIDVDDFKKVNDSLGHEAGDKVLMMIGERMTAVLRLGDVVGRLGGDEFGVILYGIGDPENAAKVARSMIQAIGVPLPTTPTTSHVGLSIGVVLLAADDHDPSVLLRRADMAMYVAKTHGKNGFRFFSEEIDTRVRSDLELEAGLRQALAEGGRGLWVAYQPQLCAQTGRLVGAEALVRWRREDGRQVSPSEFVPVAEQAGLIAELGDWVLSQVCRDLALMRAGAVELPKVSVNFSPRQLLSGSGVVQRFCETLVLFGEPVGRFEFELTESALMEEGGSVVLEAFHAAGFSLSIDDFGTGYSSLGYLKRFRVGELKIDQSFVRDLPTDGENAAIVTAVVQMSRALNIKVVAEGVETQEQAQFLQACGCHVLQGYLLGRPMSPADLVTYVQQRWAVAS